MPIRTLAVAIAAALALSACGGQSRPVAETASATSVSSVSSATSASAATSASPVGAPVKGDKPSREFVVGKWGTNGDCTMAIDLRPDGTSDGPFGAWTYSDGVISFPDEPDFRVSVTVIDDKTMQSTNASSDKPSTMTRCP
jgi:ABC-type Fe3+-hydroxamate transport system substrate-binding protein